ncbi:osmotically-inducible lipoprotein B [Morganella morganii]|uniref:glycine zipper 2TM domain-containing protein n=1 Tax=Morganella morganii TaxID=582 RepID=UPI0031B4CE32
MQRGNRLKKIVTALLVAGGLLALSGCKNLSEQEKDTAIGAELGAISGAILTDGSGLGTVGGAAVGGIIGHEAGQ